MLCFGGSVLDVQKGKQMSYTQEERERAANQICNGGKESAIAFFGRHPHLGYAVAEELQCEVNVLKKALQAAEKANKILAKERP
jgi:transposase-like protein